MASPRQGVRVPIKLPHTGAPAPAVTLLAVAPGAPFLVEVTEMDDEQELKAAIERLREVLQEDEPPPVPPTLVTAEQVERDVVLALRLCEFLGF